MKKVCWFATHLREVFHDYYIECPELDTFFSGKRRRWYDLLAGGLNRYVIKRNLLFAEGIDRLYREKDPSYCAFVADFLKKYRDYDLIIFTDYNLIHPEILHRELRKPVKILGFYDDPVSTYVRGIPYLWAFDGACYGSPGYSSDTNLSDALKRWGCMNRYWLPIVPLPPAFPEGPEKVDEAFFARRDIDVMYVGKPYSGKVERLIRLKRHFGSRLHVYGRWPLKGYGGLLRGLQGKPVYRWRVRSLTNDERASLYLRGKIGFNMHYSETPSETGNMRMYEVPLHGLMLLCDKAGLNAHEEIYVPDKEAVFYDSIDDAIEKAEFYLTHDSERIEIARNGFLRAWRDYVWEKCVLDFLNWASSLREKRGEQEKKSNIAVG